MKRYFLVALISLVSISAFAQSYPCDLTAVDGKGKEHHIQEIFHKVESKVTQVGPTVRDYYYLIEGKDTVDFKDAAKYEFEIRTAQDFWDVKVIKQILPSYNGNSSNKTDLRSDMENDALDFIRKVEQAGASLNDPYLENYIYGIIAKIAPVNMVDGRPCNVNLVILQNDDLNACMYPNGTMVINTGLLASLKSEAELVAIMTHEISHFVLDHSYLNVTKAIARKKRAEFWATFATAMTAVAEIAVASNNDYYMPGAATMGVAVLASTISEQALDRLGMAYNIKQEEEADAVAVEFLNKFKFDSDALAVALTRLKDCMLKERSNAMYFSSSTHPALVKRIEKAGKYHELNDTHYQQMASFAITSTALIKYQNRRFREALAFAEENINNHVGCSDDYLIRANCLMSLYNTSSKNDEAIKMIEKAKELDPNNINIYKSEIIATLRANNKSAAISMLHEYLNSLDEMYNAIDSNKGARNAEQTANFVAAEEIWANKMLQKVSAMTSGVGLLNID